MNSNNKKVLDIVVVGSGMAGLNFIDKYLQNGNKINVISPSKNLNFKVKDEKKIHLLPSQMRGEYKNIGNYFRANTLSLKTNCKAIGSLNFGGLSNYWGLQMDNKIFNDQTSLKKKTFNEIKKNFFFFLKRFKIAGHFKLNKNKIYSNNFYIPEQLNKLKKIKSNLFFCTQPILGFSTSGKFKGNLNNIDEKKQKLNAKNIYKKIKKKNRITFHNFYLEKIEKKKGYIELYCKNNSKMKKYKAKKLVLACGTIATTKILMNYLNIKKEVKIKHHPRLLSVFLSRKKLNYNMNFTPSLLQIIFNSSKDHFTADLRPGNKLITKSIIDAFPIMKPFEFLINFFRKRLIFSNFLLDPKFSNLYIKKKKNNFELFSKEKKLAKVLKEKNKKIYNLLASSGIVYPFYRTFFPGYGADYHYFGSVPFQNKGKLAVNNNCQLLSSKNIYIIDGSVFNFRSNRYPLGIIAANARRVAKYLSK